jgi:hypothetical protein
LAAVEKLKHCAALNEFLRKPADVSLPASAASAATAAAEVREIQLVIKTNELGESARAHHGPRLAIAGLTSAGLTIAAPGAASTCTGTQCCRRQPRLLRLRLSLRLCSGVDEADDAACGQPHGAGEAGAARSPMHAFCTMVLVPRCRPASQSRGYHPVWALHTVLWVRLSEAVSCVCRWGMTWGLGTGSL